MSLSPTQLPVAAQRAEAGLQREFHTLEAAKEAAGQSGPAQAVSRTDDGFALWEGDCDPTGWLVAVRPEGGYWCDFASPKAAERFWDLALTSHRSRDSFLAAARAAASGGNNGEAALVRAERWATVVQTLRTELDAISPAPTF